MIQQQQDFIGKFYTELPPNARPGKILDFVQNRKKKVGMEYLVYSQGRGVFDMCTVRPGTTREKLESFINAGILYVFTDQNRYNNESSINQA